MANKPSSSSSSSSSSSFDNNNNYKLYVKNGHKDNLSEPHFLYVYVHVYTGILPLIKLDQIYFSSGLHMYKNSLQYCLSSAMSVFLGI